MGHRFLHQSHASGRIGAISPRSKNARGRGEKVEVCGNFALFGVSEEFRQICYTQRFGAVPKWPKGEVCKTSIRGFESHPRLQFSAFGMVELRRRFFLCTRRVPRI